VELEDDGVRISSSAAALTVAATTYNDVGLCTLGPSNYLNPHRVSEQSSSLLFSSLSLSFPSFPSSLPPSVPTSAGSYVSAYFRGVTNGPCLETRVPYFYEKLGIYSKQEELQLRPAAGNPWVCG